MSLKKKAFTLGSTATLLSVSLAAMASGPVIEHNDRGGMVPTFITTVDQFSCVGLGETGTIDMYMRYADNSVPNSHIRIYETTSNSVTFEPGTAEEAGSAEKFTDDEGRVSFDILFNEVDLGSVVSFEVISDDTESTATFINIPVLSADECETWEGDDGHHVVIEPLPDLGAQPVFDSEVSTVSPGEIVTFNFSVVDSENNPVPYRETEVFTNPGQISFENDQENITLKTDSNGQATFDATFDGATGNVSFTAKVEDGSAVRYNLSVQ